MLKSRDNPEWGDTLGCLACLLGVVLLGCGLFVAYAIMVFDA